MPMQRPPSSEYLVDYVRQNYGNRLIAGISGKDSMVAVHWLMQQGFEVIPY